MDNLIKSQRGERNSRNYGRGHSKSTLAVGIGHIITTKMISKPSLSNICSVYMPSAGAASALCFSVNIMNPKLFTRYAIIAFLLESGGR